jgi:hypothetical protein
MILSADELKTEITYPDSDGTPMAESDPARDYLIYGVESLDIYFHDYAHPHPPSPMPHPQCSMNVGVDFDTHKKADTVDNEGRRYLHKSYVFNLARQQLLATGNR